MILEGRKKKKKNNNLLKPLPCISIAPLFRHIQGKKLPFQHHLGSPVKYKTPKEQGPTPHPRNSYLCLKRRRRQGSEMPDSCSDRMENMTDSTFNINPYAFCYVQLLCSASACSPFLSCIPEQVLPVVYHMEWSKVLHRGGRGLDQQVAEHPKVPRWTSVSKN